MGVSRPTADPAKVPAHVPVAVSAQGSPVAAVATTAERAQLTGRPRVLRGGVAERVERYCQHGLNRASASPSQRCQVNTNVFLLITFKNIVLAFFLGFFSNKLFVIMI